MTIEDKLCAEIMVKYNKMQDMLRHVAVELDFMGSDRIAAADDLLEAVVDFLEEL